MKVDPCAAGHRLPHWRTPEMKAIRRSVPIAHAMLPPRRLLIADGSPASLAALTLQERPDQTILWVPALAQAARPRPLAATRRQAAHFGTDRVVGPGSADNGDSSLLFHSAESALTMGRLLLDALSAAAEWRCGRVIWPCQAGRDLDRIAAVHEVVGCVGQLARMDPIWRGMLPEIRTPLLDCTDEQVADLIRASGAPIALCWWCQAEEASPCGDCESCHRWRAAHQLLAAA